MPFITTGRKDPIGYLSAVNDYYKARDEARNQELYGLEGPGGLGFRPNLPIPDHLGDLQREKVAERVLKQRLSAPLNDLSMDMVNHPDEFLLKTPEKRAQIGRSVKGSAENVMAGLGLLASLGAPPSLGVGLMARGLTGAGLNTGLSIPTYVADPDNADVLMDTAMGLGAGVAGLPGMVVGGVLGWSPEAKAGVLPRFAGGVLEYISKHYPGATPAVRSALHNSNRTGNEWGVAYHPSGERVFTSGDPYSLEIDGITQRLLHRGAKNPKESLLLHTHPMGDVSPSKADLDLNLHPIGMGELITSASPGSPMMAFNRKRPLNTENFNRRQDQVAEHFISDEVGDHLGGLGLFDPDYGDLSDLAQPIGSLTFLRDQALRGNADLTYNGLGTYAINPSRSVPMADIVESYWDKFHKPLFAGGGAVRRMAKYFTEDPEHLKTIQGIIKETGGQWIGDTVTGAVKPLKKSSIIGEPVSTLKPHGDTFFSPTTGELFPPALVREAQGVEGLNKWVDGPLKRYIQRDMATLNDPIRKLAEQDILHVGPDQLNYRTEHWGNPRMTLPNQRFLANPSSDLAKTWEGVSDNAIISWEAEFLRTPKYLRDNPWLSKLDPNEPVHSIMEPSNLINDLGFDHLIDELGNALNPELGLPKELLLNPKDFEQMGVERAIRHVDKINKWRAKQTEKAALADMADIPVVKEYPGGYKWVELTARNITPESEGLVPGKIRGQDVWLDENGIQTIPGKERLRNWLQNEGNAMGHCVGGYCDRVLSGQSRIFSLRDPNGQPHVTIEVSPRNLDLADSIKADQLPTHLYEDYKRRNLLSPEIRYDPVTFNPRLGNFEDQILQIKGKQNEAPIASYLPYVQDFVKSQGPWARVQDLMNARLRPAKDAFNDLELEKLKSLGVGDINDYLTPEELNKYQGLLGSGLIYDDYGFIKNYDGQRYANGGRVITQEDNPTLPTSKCSCDNQANDDMMTAVEKIRSISLAAGGPVNPRTIIKSCGGKYNG